MTKDKTVITYLRRGIVLIRRILTDRTIYLEAPLPEIPGSIETNNIGSFSERKRKRIIAFNGYRPEGKDSIGLKEE